MTDFTACISTAKLSLDENYFQTIRRKKSGHSANQCTKGRKTHERNKESIVNRTIKTTWQEKLKHTTILM